MATRRADAPETKLQWSIGIYAGPSPFRLAPLRRVGNPVLTPADVTDVPAETVADPFMLRVGQTWHMFFEVWNRHAARGQIGLAVSQDCLTWAYQGIVLEEPFHLSYPYVFEYEHNYYMIPESHEAESVRLYRATGFPAGWAYAGTLLDGGYFADPSVFRHDGTWWLFADTSTSRESAQEFKHDTLSLFHADHLHGPWREHPQNPLVAGDARIARPGGRVLILNEKIIRFAQDCYPVYGKQLRAFQVTELTTRTYRERPVSWRPVLKAGGGGWNSAGMHHVDAHLGDGQWIACVDGLGPAAMAAERGTAGLARRKSEGAR